MAEPELTIVGAGPAGLFAAFYAGMRGLKTRIIDSLPHAGGQPFALYPEKKIYDIGGIPHISGKELTEQALAQLTPFQDSTDFHLEERVLGFDRSEDGLIVHTAKADYHTRALLIATGGGAFTPRPLRVPGAEDFLNRGLSYFPKPFAEYKGHTVAVLGGGDTALDYAREISAYAKQVFVVHRRPRFRGLAYTLAQLQQATNVELVTPYVPKALTQAEHGLSLQLQKARSEDTQTIVVDDILVAYGFSGTPGDWDGWPITIDNHRIPVDRSYQTSCPGVYAIGDIATYLGKAPLIASAYGEAPTAINAIAQYLSPDDIISPLHSTTFFNNK